MSALERIIAVIRARNSRDHWMLVALAIGLYRLLRGRLKMSRGQGLGWSVLAGIILDRAGLLPAGKLQADQHSAPGDVTALSAGDTHYKLEGPPGGRVVVLVHGFCGSMSDLDLVAADLVQRGMQVLRLDNVGRGFSSCAGLDVPHTPDLFVTQIRELLLKLNLPGDLDGGDAGTIDLVGYSMGGAIAAHFAVTYPKLVRRLVLIAAAGLKNSGAPKIVEVPLLAPVLWQHMVKGAMTNPKGLDDEWHDPQCAIALASKDKFIKRWDRGVEPALPRALLNTLRHFPLGDMRMEATFRQLAAEMKRRGSGKQVLIVWGEGTEY
jgi:pimeloyl-ACP methyl ester carboxylesterase